MFHAARRAGTFMGEAFMYRVHPQTARLLELIGEGAIGEVRMIQSSFGFAMPRFDPTHRLYANDLAGGGILDVGGYPVSMARLIAGAVEGKPFLDPAKVAGMARLGESGVDEWAAALLQFPNGIIAEVACAVSLKQENVLRVLGTDGRIEVADFWFASGHEGGVGKIDVVAADGSRRTVEVDGARLALLLRGGRGRRGDPRRPPGVRAAGHELGRHARQPARARQVARRRRPEVRHRAPRGPAAHDPQRAAGGDLRHHPAQADAGAGEVGLASWRWASRTSPTSPAPRSCSTPSTSRAATSSTPASVYGGGRTERVLGEWLRARGVRDDVVIIGKGAHSPLTYPDVIARQLAESLDRLGTDHVDVYFMHRDNPDVPGRRVRRRHGRRGHGRADPRADRRLELDARAPRRGHRLRRAHRQGRRPRRSPTTSRSPR